VSRVGCRLIPPKNELALVSASYEIVSCENKAGVNSVGIRRRKGCADELSSLIVPYFNRLDPACDESVKRVREKGYSFNLPVLFMQICSSGNYLSTEQIHQE